MAVVVKNTFLDVAAEQAEVTGSRRRCRSVPRQWKPHSFPQQLKCGGSSVSHTSQETESPRSDLSFFSAMESEGCVSRMTSGAFCGRCCDDTDSRSEACDWSSIEADMLGSPNSCFNCPTPTSTAPPSPIASPRSFCQQPLLQSCLCEESGGGEMNRVLCYLRSCPCSSTPCEVNARCDEGKSVSDSAAMLPSSSEIAGADHLHRNADSAASTQHMRTKLKSESAAFRPVQADARHEVMLQGHQSNDGHHTPPVETDTRVDTVVNAAYIALTSCGQTQDVKLYKGSSASPSANIVLTAELSHGPSPAARCYDVMHLAKQSLEAIAARLPTTALLSARIQKEEHGYSLRSNIACVPKDAEDRMCWDLFKRGHCPRRGQCRWYHPTDSDINRIKITIKYSDAVQNIQDNAVSEERLSTNQSLEKHKLSLGDLL